MSNAIRKLQRNVIKTKCYEENHNTKGFKKEWDKYHVERIEQSTANGTVVTRKRTGAKKKQRHEDNGRIFMKKLKAMKNYIDNVKKEKATKKLLNNTKKVATAK